MNPPSKPKRLLKDIYQYLRDSVSIWWLGIGGVLGFWDQLARLIPAHWKVSTEMPSWLPEVLAFAALLIGPYLAWRKKNKELLKVKAMWWEAFQKEQIDLLFSESSRMTHNQRFEALGALFDARKAEIQRGDYDRAAEIFPIVRAYLPLLARCVPVDSVARPNREAEIAETYKAVEAYMLELNS